MSERPWYRRFPANFIAGTVGLSLEEKGAYSLILDLIYDRGGPIPDDARYLAGICGCSVRKWHTVRQSLIDAGKIVARDGVLTNVRAEEELEKAAKYARERAESGRKGGEQRAENSARASNNNDIGQAEPKHARAFYNHTTPKEDIPPHSPPAEFETFWAEFPNKVGKREALRAFDSARKRVSLETIMEGLRRYAAKTDDRPWCNPSTFLNQDRWADAPAQVPPRQGKLTTARVLADLANRMRVNENGTSPDPPRLTHVGRVSGE